MNNTCLTTGSFSQSRLLLGDPVVRKLERWCSSHNKARDGVFPRLAVLYFDTGDDAKEYLHIKAAVAARAGIEYTTHKVLPDASIEEVNQTITGLNQDSRVHGILIQRPIPQHLCEAQVMDMIWETKHIEEYRLGKRSNIAVDGLRKVLAVYHNTWMLDLDIVLFGGTNIITPGFKAEMRRRFHRIDVRTTLDGNIVGQERDTIIITEMNKGGAIKPSMLGLRVRLVVDVGFDVQTKMGDLDPVVHKMKCITVVPTPGGVLPVLLWLMMERTIKARTHVEPEGSLCLTTTRCTVL